MRLPTMTKPEIVNGINVDDLKQLVAGVAAGSGERRNQLARGDELAGPDPQPQPGRRLRPRPASMSRARSPSISTSLANWAAPTAIANPQEHLIAALNACMTVGYVAQCAIRGIETRKPRDRDHRRHRPARLPRPRCICGRGIRDLSLHRPDQGRRHARAVRGSPRRGDGDLAQLLQHREPDRAGGYARDQVETSDWARYREA